MIALSLSLSLTLSLFLLQDPGQVQASSKTLPKEQTFMFLELAPLERWRQVRKQVVQIQAFEDPSMAGFFRWLAASDGDAYQLSWRAQELFRVVEAFDQGFTVAHLFKYENKKGGPVGVALVAAGSKGQKVREAGKRFDALFSAEKQGSAGSPVKAKREYRRTQREMVLSETPLADSPVRSRYATWKTKEGEHEHQFDYLSWRTPHLSWTFFGRRAAFFANTRKSKTFKKLGEDHLTRLIGLMRSRGGAEMGEALALHEGETRLLRGGLRFGHFSHDEAYMNKRTQGKVRAMGLHGFKGVQAGLFSGPAGLREIYQITDGGEEGSFFGIFKEPKAPLAQVLSHLSPKTVAFARLGVDGKALSAWLEGFRAELLGLADDEWSSILRIARSLLALPEQEVGQENLDDLGNVTLFVLPSSPGAPIPQPGILLECPEREGEVRQLLETIGTAILNETVGSDDSKVKLGKLGKGEDAVEYLSFKKLLNGGMGGMGGMRMRPMSLLTNLLGGGFISAKRAGPYLVLGCNPKDVRRMVRDIRKGKTLLTRQEIQKTFAATLQPGAPRKILDAWFDPASVLKGAGLISSLLPVALIGMSYASNEAAETIPLKEFPRLGGIAKILHPESIQAERISSNIRIEHRGGTLLSPMAWWGFGVAAYYWDILAKLVR